MNATPFPRHDGHAVIPSTSAGCPGSIRWGIDHGRIYDINGIWPYGRTITDSDSHADALETVLAWDCLWNDEAFTFITPQPDLMVYRVGPKYDYMRSEGRQFTVRLGRAIEVTH